MPSPLISSAALQNNIGDNTVVFDCRFSLSDTELGQKAYQAGHIPGSHYLHLDRALTSAVGKHGGRHPLPDAKQFEQAMRLFGVNQHTLVIAYDDQRFAFASRLWWLLRYFGHNNVRVLDGGFSGWCKNNGGIETGSVSPVELTGNFKATPQPSQTVDYHNICQHLSSTERLLIDSREAPRYRGLEEPIDPIAGHIPAAANYPWQEVTDSEGCAYCPASQRQRWAALPNDKELVVYCGSGVTACVNLLALELAGIKGAKLYPGSWSDWCLYECET